MSNRATPGFQTGQNYLTTNEHFQSVNRNFELSFAEVQDLERMREVFDSHYQIRGNPLTNPCFDKNRFPWFPADTLFQYSVSDSFHPHDLSYTAGSHLLQNHPEGRRILICKSSAGPAIRLISNRTKMFAYPPRYWVQYCY